MASDSEKSSPDMSRFITDWMKSFSDTMESMAATQARMFAFPADAEGKKAAETGKAAGKTSGKTAGEAAGDDNGRGTRKSWAAMGNTWQKMFSALMAPENLEANFKGAAAVPEVAMRLAQQTADAMMTLQTRWMERAAAIGQRTKAYNFENLDKEVFKSLREIYETEFQKYLNVPQLGLNRFYQERFNRFLDKMTLFQTTLSEFLQMFYIPIEKSAMVMQEKLEQMADKGDLKDDPQAFYRLWIKVLEGHYMNLLKSPEYLQTLHKTIESLVNYNQAREDFLQDIVRHLPVPTLKEMDELYKEIYLMKKQIRSLSKKVEGNQTL